MTKVFITDVSKLNSDVSVYADCVSEYRYQKAVGYKNVSDRLLSIGAELLLSKYLGRKPCYTVDIYGKPTGEIVNFNFSHSGNITICGVSDNAVGVDVEKIREVNIDIAKRKFCKEEYNAIINSNDQNNAFFEYWVKKESYLKALGKGLRVPLNKFDTDKICDWDFYTYHIEGYKICACTKEKCEFIWENPDT